MENPSQFEVITASDQAWDGVLKEVGTYDFYHMAAFHRLAELRGEGSPLMAVFREHGHTVAFPLMMREIDLPWAEAGQVDATSVVGMSGPVASDALPEDIRQHWLTELQCFLAQRGIVSVYSRLNYAMDQASLLAGLGTVTQRHPEVSLDLTAPPEEQAAHCRRGHRRQIAKLRSMGFACEEVGPKHVDDFVRMYYETMKNVEADAASYFDRSYFDYLLREMPDEIHLVRCAAKGKTVMTVMFSTCNGIIHVLYGGVEPSYGRLSPVKLVIDDLRQRGNALGARLMLLGSGRTLTRDTLFQFKMGFGGHEQVYSTWSHIVIPEVYDKLCRNAIRAAGVEPDDSYFPDYRHPLLVSADRAGRLRARGLSGGYSSPPLQKLRQ